MIVYITGVDDSISECDLDSKENWDFKVFNNKDTFVTNRDLGLILNHLIESLQTFN